MATIDFAPLDAWAADYSAQLHRDLDPWAAAEREQFRQSVELWADNYAKQPDEVVQIWSGEGGAPIAPDTSIDLI